MSDFGSVSARKRTLQPLLEFVSFPTVHAIYKPWEYKQSIGKHLKSHPCNSRIQSRKIGTNTLSPSGSEYQGLHPHSGDVLLSVATEDQNLQATSFWEDEGHPCSGPVSLS